MNITAAMGDAANPPSALTAGLLVERSLLLAGDAAALATWMQGLRLRGVGVVAVSDQPRQHALPAPLAALLLADVCGDDAPAGKAVAFPLPTLIALAVRRGGIGWTRTWLACHSAAAAQAAINAGCAGVVAIGTTSPAAQLGEASLATMHAVAADLLQATQAMVPRGGGCWHG